MRGWGLGTRLMWCKVLILVSRVVSQVVNYTNARASNCCRALNDVVFLARSLSRARIEKSVCIIHAERWREAYYEKLEVNYGRVDTSRLAPDFVKLQCGGRLVGVMP